jgi:dipeptidyl aminopeptidase/acylaminoacyl peptidase
MFQCAVSINGVTHLPEQVDFDLDKFESDELQTYIKESIGDPDKDQKMLRDRSPALQAAKINVPILLIHGDEDKIVPYEQAEIMYEALEKHNKQVEFITLEETGHNFLRYREDIREVFDALERFLAESLKEKK